AHHNKHKQPPAKQVAKAPTKAALQPPAAPVKLTPTQQQEKSVNILIDLKESTKQHPVKQQATKPVPNKQQPNKHSQASVQNKAQHIQPTKHIGNKNQPRAELMG
ncbi:hypothetical protein As57867_005494, partial [Aphanomyces stellatus]